MRISEIFLLENLSINVPYHRLTMTVIYQAQVTLGKFFSGVPQKRKSDGDSKKIYEHKRKRGFIDSWSKDFDGLQDSSDGMISINVPYHRLTMTVIYHAFNILIAKAIHIRDNFLKLEHRKYL
jgi:hypothetical protein